jgi:YD repeat-containing protein
MTTPLSCGCGCRLTRADYSTGELYAYDYDPVGNRLQQIIGGDTTSYQYDATNRISQVDSQSYTFDANGNLLFTGVMSNTWDAANRLIATTRQTGQTTNRLTPGYNGLGDRVGQTADGQTTNFALDVQGLPEVIQTSDGELYLHLPGVIMTESSAGDVRYLLSDGLGSVRQAVDACIKPCRGQDQTTKNHRLAVDDPRKERAGLLNGPINL